MKNKVLFMLDVLYEKVNTVEGLLYLLTFIVLYLAFRFARSMF